MATVNACIITTMGELERIGKAYDVQEMFIRYYDGAPNCHTLPTLFWEDLDEDEYSHQPLVERGRVIWRDYAYIIAQVISVNDMIAIKKPIYEWQWIHLKNNGTYRFTSHKTEAEAEKGWIKYEPSKRKRAKEVNNG